MVESTTENLSDSTGSLVSHALALVSYSSHASEYVSLL